MERAIGEVFTFSGFKYAVVMDDSSKSTKDCCSQCAFTRIECESKARIKISGYCSDLMRKDKTNVHFERV